MGEVVGELGALLLLALDDLGGQKRALLQEAAQPAEQRGVLGEALGQDVAGAGERLLHVRHLVGDIGRGQRLGRRPAVGEDRLGQRPQPLLPRDSRPGAALGLVGQIEVLEHRLARRRGDARLELGRELLLLADRAEDRRPPGLELAQVGEPVGEAAQLGIVEPAGRLLAVARDEGNRGACIEERRGGRYLVGPCADFGGDGLGDAPVGIDCHGDSREGIGGPTLVGRVRGANRAGCQV